VICCKQELFANGSISLMVSKNFATDIHFKFGGQMFIRVSDEFVDDISLININAMLPSLSRIYE
jgi:hypothetical protein